MTSPKAGNGRVRRSYVRPVMVGEAIVVAALKAAIRVEGVRGIAQRAGVNAGTVSAAVKGRQQVSARLASALGFRKVTRYERVGEK